MNSGGADSDLGDLLELYSESEVKFDALEDEIESDNVCGICSENLRIPRMLSCLHEFCEACLEDLEGGNVSPELKNIGENEGMRPQSKNGVLICPKCEQDTKLGPNGVKGLTLDLILTGPSEAPPTDANGSSILCTSCKAKEPAVGRCEDCSNFLCNNCFTAHKYMRVLENHVITTLEELQARGQVSPPPKYFPCPRHADKPIDYFCLSCQEACCIQCLSRVHFGPEHNCDSAQSISNRFRTEIPLLGREAKSRLDDCRKVSRQLEGSFSQLEQQRTAAKKTVEDAFQAFRAALEGIKDSVIGKIEEKHKERELKAMENLNKLQTRVNKIEHAEAFTGRMVDFGEENAAALVEMWSVLRSQLYGLAGPVEPVDVTSRPIKFEYDVDVFEKAVKNCIGKFMEEEATPSSPVAGTLPIGILQEEQTHILPQGLLSPEAVRNSPVHPGPIQRPSQSLSLSPELTPVASVSGVLPNGPVGSATGNMGAASLGDIQALTSALANTDLNNGYAPSHRTPTPDMTNQLGLRSIHQAYNTTTMQEFNLATQLANYVDKERQPMHGRHVTSPSLGPPAVAMTLADLIAGVESNTHSHAMNNLQALVQLNNVQTSVPPQSNPILGMRNAPSSRIGMSGPPGPVGPSGLGSYSNLLNGLSNPPPPIPNPIRLPNSYESSSASLPAVGAALGASAVTDALQCWNDASRTPKLSEARSSELPVSLNVNLPLPTAIPPKTQKVNPMSVRVKFGSQASMTKGGASSSLASPHGFCLGPGEQIFVADTQNHSIKVFDINGQFIHAFGNAGQEDGQLWYPRKVAIIRTSGLIVICDRGTERTRIQLFTCKGMFVRRLRVQYIDIVASVAVNRFGHIIAVDSNNPAIFQLDEQGNLKCWIDCIPYMKEPSDIAVYGSEYYVCDFKGHCVCVFHENGQFLRKIGGEPLTMFPNGIDMSDAGDLLVCDSHGNRFHVVVFSKDGTLTAEFDCPYVKVSRCAGLKITPDGYIITLAKNNHQVLVMNTLYIQ